MTVYLEGEWATEIELKRLELSKVTRLGRRNEFISAGQMFLFVFGLGGLLYWAEGFGPHIYPFAVPLAFSGFGLLAASARMAWYGLIFMGLHVELQKLEEVQAVMES